MIPKCPPPPPGDLAGVALLVDSDNNAFVNRLLLACVFMAVGCSGQRRGGYGSGNPAVQPGNAAPDSDDCKFLMEDCTFYGMDAAYCRKMTGC